MLREYLVTQVIPGLAKDSGGLGIIVAHQTFLDCLLRLLLDGTTDHWRYGGAKYKLAKAGQIEVRVVVGGPLQDLAFRLVKGG